MIYKNYEELRQKAAALPKKTVVIPAAADAGLLKTADEAAKQGIADFILVGNEPLILNLLQENTIKNEFTVIDEKDDALAALKAAELVRTGEADILMKGMLNSSTFLKAVLDPEKGLRSDSVLSHLAIFEAPSYKKLMFYTDGGMNTYPDLKGKVGILKNAMNALHKLGIETPKTAVLTANEQVNPKMPATVDADEIAKLAQMGEFGDCIVEGPVALDVALNKKAAEKKGIESRISGDTDLFLVPNIDAGNMVGKALMYAADAKMAGIVLGGTAPIVMTSRAENMEGKLNSLLIAGLLA